MLVDHLFDLESNITMQSPIDLENYPIGRPDSDAYRSLVNRSEFTTTLLLHFENARSGGDWLETKLLTCGPNTNPWYQECSDRARFPGSTLK